MAGNSWRLWERRYQDLTNDADLGCNRLMCLSLYSTVRVY